MEYIKTNWKNLPDTTTPITADNLNNIEDGIEYLFNNATFQNKARLVWLNSENYNPINNRYTEQFDLYPALENDYDILEVFYQESTTSAFCYSSRFLRANGMTRCMLPSNNIYRNVEFNTNSVTGESNIAISEINNTEDGSYCIPIAIVAYNLNLLNLQ